MRKNIRIKQQDYRDCGAACLASVAAHYGRQLPIARVRQLCHTDRQGTNVLGMVQGLNALGFYAKGVKGADDALPQIPLPAIAHVVLSESAQHYVVLYKVGRRGLSLMDPATGEMKRYSMAEFRQQWSGVLLLLEPNEYFVPEDAKEANGQRFWNLVKPHRAMLLQALLGAVVYTLLGLCTSLYIAKITDSVLLDGNVRLLNLLSLGMLILLLFQLFIGAVKSVLVLQTGQRMDRHLILGYYKHLLTLPQRFFDTMKVGEIMSRVNDAVKIRTLINDTAIQMLVNSFIVLFSFALMFTFYWKLALIVGALVPLYILLYAVSNRWNRRVERRLMEQSAVLESHLVESLYGMKTIKQFDVAAAANDRTDASFSRLLKSIYSSAMNTIFSVSSAEFLSRAVTVIMLWAGARYVMQREITLGELLSFYALVGFLTPALSQLVGMNKAIQHALIAADRLFEIMDLASEESSPGIALPPDAVGSIHFDRVTFGYGSRGIVFQDFSCSFEKGKTTAIVGQSGSGKSSIAALIQQVYPVHSGKIRVGDYDIRYVSKTSLRSVVAVVPQEIHLFSGSLIDNIALGDTFPDMHRIIRLMTDLGMMDFVERLPDRLQTQLGERGAMLSGGQKQRIAIARALYRQPEVLILDEATSALDSQAEAVIQSAIAGLQRQGKTVIIIAHRLSTVVDADKIMVLHEGQIVQEGSHQELLRCGPSLYRDMWERQVYGHSAVAGQQAFA